MKNPQYKLYLFVSSSDEEIKQLYREKVLAHNDKVNNSQFPDSGFDLLIAYDYLENFEKNKISDMTVKLPQGVKCAMYNLVNEQYTGYYLYPRSSIIKTPLRLANSVGIIDAGYRGEIIAVVDNIDRNNDSMNVVGNYAKKKERLFQICAPNLSAFEVEIIENEEILGKTERGEGGFGSTN